MALSERCPAECRLRSGPGVQRSGMTGRGAVEAETDSAPSFVGRRGNGRATPRVRASSAWWGCADPQQASSSAPGGASPSQRFNVSYSWTIAGILPQLSDPRYTFDSIHYSGWIGLDWTGLDWTGLDWTGLDWTGLHGRVRPQRHRSWPAVFCSARRKRTSKRPQEAHRKQPTRRAADNAALFPIPLHSHFPACV